MILLGWPVSPQGVSMGTPHAPLYVSRPGKAGQGRSHPIPGRVGAGPGGAWAASRDHFHAHAHTAVPHMCGMCPRVGVGDEQQQQGLRRGVSGAGMLACPVWCGGGSGVVPAGRRHVVARAVGSYWAHGCAGVGMAD